jgi:radical SAM protein with 4Fe4S-binding SPASM domain
MTDQNSTVPTITFPEFLSELQAEERRLPVQGTIETTFRCNLRCVHCYVNEPAADRGVRERELSLAELRGIVDQVVEAGCLHLLLTGGEALLRPDFPELYLYAIRSGLRVTVFTNGTLVSEAIAELFDEYRPHSVEISLYGMTRQTYERVSGVPGSYDRCLAGVERLRSRGIPLVLKTMALAWNEHEVEAMRHFAEERGLRFKHDSLLNARVDCGANRNPELQLGAERAVALQLQRPGAMQAFKRQCDEVLAAGPRPASEAVYTCGAGRNTFTVDPYGRLQMCQLSRRAFHDLRRGRFEEGWERLFPRLRARKWHSNAVCRRCSLLPLCGNCPGAAELEHGDPEAVVERFCEITHLQAFTARGEVPGHRRDAACCLGAAQRRLLQIQRPTAAPA